MFKATHNGQSVAVKAMFAVAGAAVGAASLSEKVPASVVKSVRREAMIMCSLNHPNILRVFGVVPERAWIVMELCEGGALDTLLRDIDEELDRATMARIAAETATGIAYLHLPDVSIVHGDMKAGERAADQGSFGSNLRLWDVRGEEQEQDDDRGERRSKRRGAHSRVVGARALRGCA